MSGRMLKILVLGDSGVGKTNLVEEYTLNAPFTTRRPSTIAVEFYAKDLLVNGRDDGGHDVSKRVNIQFWDTAGQERYHALTSTLYRGAHGAIVVFDITLRSTFDNVEKWVEEFRHYAGSDSEDTPLVLVGNKADLFHIRAVPTSDAMGLAAKLGMFYVETSALSRSNVNVCFERIVHMACGVAYDPLASVSAEHTPPAERVGVVEKKTSNNELRRKAGPLTKTPEPQPMNKAATSRMWSFCSGA